jgi:hypothetical protein
MVNFTTWPLYPTEITPLGVKHAAGQEAELVWTFWKRDKTSTPAGIRTPDLPARSLGTILTTLARILF